MVQIEGWFTQLSSRDTGVNFYRRGYSRCKEFTVKVDTNVMVRLIIQNKLNSFVIKMLVFARFYGFLIVIIWIFCDNVCV